MTAVVVLVGRPNVGKSTLFNRLTGRRDALVADRPGLTRDRIYGEARHGGRRFLVVDTGGLEEAVDELAGQVQAQTRQAVAEADRVLFLVDARAGLTPADEAIAADLRRRGVPVLLVANKAEGLDPELATAEFHRLGLGAPVPVSAAHGQGMARLLDALVADLPPEPEAAAGAGAAPKVAVLGRPNAGKSTLVNALLGEQRVLVADQPGTTRDSIYVDLERDGRRYVLIDTAGVRRRARVQDAVEKFSVVRALKALEDADVILFVLDAQRGVSAQDATLAGLILEAGRALVLVVNKWDRLPADQRARVQAEIRRRLPFLPEVTPHFVSALHGSGVGALFSAVDAAYRAATAEFPTARLNRILEQAVRAVPPPMVRGRPVKLKFVHQAGRNPPRLRIFGTRVEGLPAGYRRYLANRFRRALGLAGTPLVVEFSPQENPYIQKGKGRRRAAAGGPRPRRGRA